MVQVEKVIRVSRVFIGSTNSGCVPSPASLSRAPRSSQNFSEMRVDALESPPVSLSHTPDSTLGRLAREAGYERYVGRTATTRRCPLCVWLPRGIGMSVVARDHFAFF